MLAKDSVRSRLDSDNGLSFTEFSYSLLQANDFRHLYEHEGVELQAGGSDQWGNIVAGVDLIRRGLGEERARHDPSPGHQGRRLQVRQVGRMVPCGWTPTRHRRTSSVSSGCRSTTPWWAGTCTCSRWRPWRRSKHSLAEHETAPERRVAQRALAAELTRLVHGADADAAAEQAAARAVRRRPDHCVARGARRSREEVPSSVRTLASLDDLLPTLVEVGLATSNGDARRTLRRNEASARTACSSTRTPSSAASRLLHGRYLLLRKGKANHHLIEIS